MEFLKYFDVFGTAITFRVLDNEKYHNSISIFCSLFLFIFTIIFTYFCGFDFVFHSESKTLQSTRTSKTYEFYNLTMNDLFFAWRIEDLYGKEINFTNILFPYIGYHSYQKEKEIKIKNDRCKNFNLSFSIPKDINNFYCSDLGNYSIGGGWENENKIDYFYLNIDICNNTFCPSKIDFYKLLNLYGGLYLIIYYPTISFLPEEEIPYQISYNKANVFLDAQIITVNRFYIQKYIFEDDDGWIFPNTKINNFFGIADIKTYNYMNDLGQGDEIPLNSYIYAGNFYIDKKYSYYKRWFTKAFESLAIVNAFYKTLYIIFNFFSSICNHFILYQIIIEKSNDNNYQFHSNNKFNISHSDIEMSNIPNKNDIINTPNINFKLINSKNKIKSSFNNKKFNDFQLGSFYNKDAVFPSFANQIKGEIENNKQIPKKMSSEDLIYKRISHQKVSNYILLFFHIFHCCLSHNKKILYNMNNMSRNLLFKKICIERYIDLHKKVDFLLNAQYQKGKFQSQVDLAGSSNFLNNQI